MGGVKVWAVERQCINSDKRKNNHEESNPCSSNHYRRSEHGRGYVCRWRAPMEGESDAVASQIKRGNRGRTSDSERCKGEGGDGRTNQDKAARKYPASDTDKQQGRRFTADRPG